MNLPPGPGIQFTIEAGAPTVVRVTHKGQKYTLRLIQSVIAVHPDPSGAKDPNGMPLFSVSSIPNMIVQKDEGS